MEYLHNILTLNAAAVLHFDFEEDSIIGIGKTFGKSIVYQITYQSCKVPIQI